MESLPWDHIGAGTGWTVAVGLGLFIVRQISTGNWVTRREHDETLRELRAKDQTITALTEHVRLLGEVGTTMKAVLRAIQVRRRRPQAEDELT